VNQSAPGKVRLGAVLWILVVVVGIYLGIQFVPPYWTYLNMTDPVKEAAMSIFTSADEARAKAELVRRAGIEGLTLDQDNIEIAREEGMLVVRVSWVAPVELPRYTYNIHFRIEERVPLR